MPKGTQPPRTPKPPSPRPVLTPARAIPEDNPQAMWFVSHVDTKLLAVRRAETAQDFPRCMRPEEYVVLAGFLTQAEAAEFYTEYLNAVSGRGKSGTLLLTQRWTSNRQKIVVRIGGRDWLRCN